MPKKRTIFAVCLLKRTPIVAPKKYENMKTNFPIIKLFLRENKTLADRTHPIMLRCSWKGRKEISTHFSCMSNQWDEKNERLKKSYPNAATVNQIIGQMKASAIERRDRLFATGGTVTPEAILWLG